VDGVVLTELIPEGLTLLWGAMQQAMMLANADVTVSWPGPSAGNTHALALRRDRVLVVNGASLAEGWHSDIGLAVSDMTRGFRAATLSGPLCFEVLKRGTEISRSIPSGSVSRGFAGYPVFLHTVEGPETYRLYVPRAVFEGFWDLIETFAFAALRRVTKERTINRRRLQKLD